MIDDEADFGNIMDAPAEVQTAAKFRPKVRAKPRKPSVPSKSLVPNPTVVTTDEDGLSQEHATNQEMTSSKSLGNETIGDAASFGGILDTSTDDVLTVSAVDRVSQNEDHNDDMSDVAAHHENLVVSDTKASSIHSSGKKIDDLADFEGLFDTPVEEEKIVKFKPKIQVKLSKRASKSRKSDQKAVVSEDLKLRSRKKSQKVGMSDHTADDDFDEDHVEPSAGKQDNDNGGEYAVGGKQRVRRKSREKHINKEPLRGSKRTLKSSTIEESQQQNLQQNKSEVPSRGRKRALKDTLTEQPEKKLTHRIRQKRTIEVKTLLEKPDHEIDRMKLSVMHLRLLQEARERIKSKTIPSGPSSSNQSSQFGDTDDFDPYGENYDNDRTENHGLENATKLNYHSYMNKQTRAKWSKSDTDLFYQGLQQFGSDFKTEEKKHPMQVHDAILHRSRDNVYLKQVIKQLNIEDLQRDITNTHNKQEGASNGDPGNENVLDDFINGEEEHGSNWADTEEGTHRSEVNEGEHVSATADDDLDVFDWY